MKIKRSIIVNDVSNMIRQLHQMQGQNQIVIPFKVGYVLSKLNDKSESERKKVITHQNALVKKECEVDEKGFPVFIDVTENGNTRKELKYKNDNGKKLVEESYQSYMNEEIDYTPPVLSMSELEKTDNMPPQFISLIEQVVTIVHTAELKLV